MSADPALVRGGVVRSVRSAAAKIRTWSPPVLLAVLSAGAFTSVLGGPGLLGAGIGALTAVGGNLLTDVVKSAIDGIRAKGGRPEDVEAELVRRIQEALESGGERAAGLRTEIAGMLREYGLAGAAIEAAVQSGDRDLQAALAEGLAGLGAEFGEFAFVLSDVDDRLRLIRESVDQQRAELQVSVGLQYRQATDTRLLLEHMAVIERRTRPAGQAGGARGPRRPEGSPYKGLATYGEADADVFSGREVVTAQLVSRLSGRLSGPGLLVVTGASGAGKSSLLRAGLFPAIGRGDLSEPARHWPRHVLDQPTRTPLSLLATLLAGLAGLEVGTVLDALKRAPGDASLLVRQAVDTDARRRGVPEEEVAGCRLILVVDQFEEVFTAKTAAEVEERAAFIAALHAAATVPVGSAGTPAALVVIAVRGDVIDRCADHPPLVEALQGPFTLGAMTERELRAAITVPADAAGLEVESGLVDTILGELRSSSGGFDAGVLPLLSQAMLTVWEHREGDRLTHRGYALTGGVTHAVTASAEAAYESLAPDGREVARQAFQRLTVVSPEAKLARRTVPRAALSEMDEVLEVFARRRLIVVDAGSTQISHDALLQHWPRLRGWLEADLTGHALRSQLIDDADDWERNGRNASYLYRGERLTAVLHAETRWRADPLTGTPRLFLDAGVRAESRGRRQRRLTFVTLSGLLAVALVFGGVALFQGSAAREQGAAAREQQRVATARQLVAKAEAALHSDPRTALTLNVAAYRIHPDAETYASLQTAITTTPYAGRLTGVASAVRSVDYSADGRYLAAGFDSGAIMLWDLRDPLRPRRVGAPFKGFEAGATVLFSGDHRLVAVSWDGDVTIWDLADPEHPRPLGNPVRGTKYRDMGAWLSPDGTVLATSAKADPALRFWDLTDPTRVRPIGGPLTVYPKRVQALAFSPDGATIATSGSGDDPVLLWDIGKRAALVGKRAARAGKREAPRRLGRIVPRPRDLVDSLSFSADGRILAAAGMFRGIGLWNVSDPAAPRPARDLLRVSMGSKVTFSPRAATLATTAGRDVGLLLWDLSNPDFPSRTETLIAGQDDTTLAFSPDGGMVATGGTGGHITLWNLGRAGRPRALGPPFVGHQGDLKEIYALDMTPDGTMIATGGRDTTVVLWDTADPARPRRLNTLHGHMGEGVDAVAFRPDGGLLATGDGQETVILWDLADPARPRRLPTSLTGPTDIIRNLVFSPDGRTLIVAGDQGTIFWDVSVPGRSLRLASVLEGERVLSVRRVRDGRVLAVVVGSGTYATPTATAVADPTLPATATNEEGADSGGSAKPRTDGPGDPNGARLWDITDPRHPRRLGPGLIGHDADVATAAISPTGDLLATGDGKGAVILWEGARRLGDPLVAHGTISAVSLEFAPTTDIMVTGGIDQNAYLWDLGNRILPRQLGTALSDNVDTVWQMAFSANGETLATAGSRGDVVLWDLRPTYELRRHLDETACLVTGGGLSREQWTRYLSGLPYQDVC
ncbi:nSTAND1 domain-containing NTPase [Nonomuraea solani]|uniref:nSTAND1 domain-containing NTPase n=1 Tax=Nonomuraea solani TaxID=1144553 RepID=UPI00135A9C23|nr:hypothetical protein [Nonomuraea solani]